MNWSNLFRMATKIIVVSYIVRDKTNVKSSLESWTAGGIQAKSYHANLPNKDEVHAQWKNDEFKIVVATVSAEK